MFRQVFNPENGFFRVIGKFTDVMLLSLLWLVCSLPLFTLGPATAALYRSTVRCVRGGQDGPFTMFFATFKENFKVGALTSLVVIAVGAGLILLRAVLYALAGTIYLAGIYYYAFHVLLLIPLGILCYLFPVLSRFTFRVGGLLGNSARLAVAHLPSTLLMALVLVGAVLLCLQLWLLIIVMPALVALVHSFLLERIFKPYETQPEQEG